jgi:hypothetical protein
MKHLFWSLATLVCVAFMALAAPAPAVASACPSYPYALANGQTADATQVMGNFNSILSCANSALATSGANSNITSLNGLTTPLSPSQGGTGATGLSSFAATFEPYLQPYLPFDFYVFQGSVSGNGWTLGAYQPSTSVVLTSGAARCTYGTAATSSTTYTLTDNGTTVATVTFTSSGCSFAFPASPYTVAAGHLLKLVGPATGDTTLADIGMTFGGTRN